VYLEFNVDRRNKIRFSPTLKKFFWIESESSRNINLVCPMGMQEIYKGIAISKGLAKFDDLYFVTRPKEKIQKPKAKRKASTSKKGEFFIKI